MVLAVLPAVSSEPDYRLQSRGSQLSEQPSLQHTSASPARGEEDVAPSLLSAVAHELRAPLMALTWSSEQLVEQFEQLEPRQIRSTLSTIHRRSLWLQGLVENLLCGTTVREGRFQVQPQQINLIDLVQEAQSTLEPLLKQRAQQVRLSARGPVAEVWADGRRIGQVLINLISNASKFGRVGTLIDVGLLQRRNIVRVTVADRGPGLPSEGAERLFEPFYRAVSAARSGIEGTGLGLAIVKWIVEAHGGRVGAENRPGGGARFRFELPTASADAQAGRDEGNGHEARETRRRGSRSSPSTA
jgi:two-component system sensor histidine kinase KdpD